jgi:hypothetical protein
MGVEARENGCGREATRVGGRRWAHFCRFGRVGEITIFW